MGFDSCVCVGAVLSDLSVSEAFERELFIFSARLVSSSSAPSAFAKRKARVTALIGPTATENEFLLNAKVTITRPSSHLPPSLSIPFLFCRWRKANSRAAYSNKSCCLSGSLQMITCLPLNCLSSLPPSRHLHGFTKKPGERERERTIFFVKRSVSVTGFTAETFIIILIKAKRVIFPAPEHFPCPRKISSPPSHLPHLTRLD